MSRWLLGKDRPITEPAIKLLSDNELQCTPQGQVMLLAGARSTYDLNEDYEKQLAVRRAEKWMAGDRTQLLAKVRQLAGIRRLEELPKPKAENFGGVQQTGYRIERVLLKPEEGMVLPALQFIPEKPKAGQAAVYLHEKGKAADAAPGGDIERLVQEGITVLAVDLPGTGQTAAATEPGDGYTAYLLGRSYVGLRAEDILISARWLKEQMPPGEPAAVRLIAVGDAGIPALHAAALEPELFQSATLSRATEIMVGGNPRAAGKAPDLAGRPRGAFDLRSARPGRVAGRETRQIVVVVRRLSCGARRPCCGTRPLARYKAPTRRMMVS